MPPPPPPPPPSRKTRNALIAGALVAIILVAGFVSLFYFKIITLNLDVSKTDSTSAPTPSETGANGVLIGTVSDTSGTALADVTVTIGGKTGTTNLQGWFTISHLPTGDKQTAKFVKPGYVTTYRTVNIQQGQSNSVEGVMGPVGKTQTFDSSQGATITNAVGDSYLKIGANALQTKQGAAYSGTANASMTTFDPSNQNEALAFPGQYIGESDQTVLWLKSFAFIDILITDLNGQELDLAPSQTAILSIHVSGEMQSDAAALTTCPLWYFDTENGVWLQQGQGTYDTSTASFTGEVSHLSAWSYSKNFQAAYLSGSVVDKNGNPIEGASIMCSGPGWVQTTWNNGQTATGEDGLFIRIPVEPNVVVRYFVTIGGHRSEFMTAGPLAEGTEHDFGSIVLSPILMTMSLSWGSSPRDLDSHLVAKLADGSSFHIYYGNKGSLTSSPFASLDTDSTESYGPEVMSIAQFQPGIYQYSVRQYSDDGTLSTSGASVTVISIVQGHSFIRTYQPSAGASGNNIWTLLKIFVDPDGKISAIADVDIYGTGDDESPLLYPT